MARKVIPKPDNPEQYKRFLETAREVGAEEPGEAVDRLFDQVARSKPAEKPNPPKRKSR
jgi:hypothetical protein